MRAISMLLVLILPASPSPAGDGSAAAILIQFESELTGRKGMPVPLLNKYRTKLVALGRAATPDLARAVADHDNWKVRYLALTALRRLKDPAAIPSLIEALHDRTVLQHSFNGMEDRRTAQYLIRKDAARTLKAIGPDAVRALRKILPSPRHRDFANAVYALGVIGSPSAIEALIPIARNRSEAPAVRLDAVFGIAAGETRDAKVLADLLREPGLRQDVVKTVMQRRNKKVIPALLPLIGQAARDPETARAAAEILVTVGGKKWKPADLKDQVDYFLLAGKATSIAGKIRKPAISRLAYWARSDRQEMRRQAIRALSRFRSSRRVKDTAAGDVLLELIDHRDAEVRKQAVSALQNKRDYRAMEPLIRKLGTADVNRKYYYNTLRCWTRQDFGMDPDRWSAWWRQNGSSFRR